MSDDPLLEPRNDLGSLPKPGEIIIYDYTDNTVPKRAATVDFEVKAVQWNIERAYKLDEIIDLLKDGITSQEDSKEFKSIKRIPRRNTTTTTTTTTINNNNTDNNLNNNSKKNFHSLAYSDFDVMAIQEFDIGCARSDYRNSAQEMARALKMRCIFLCEFEELYSDKLRSKRDQGGGVHGNGILTWWDVERVEVIEHCEIFAWERDGEKLNEPRRGKRRSLACFLKHPLNPDHRILVYTVHLEIFCGIFGRLRQFSAILEHSRRNMKDHPRQMILGDLNTMAHGLARLFPKYCCDVMRWRSLGWSESEWWQRNLFTALLEYDKNPDEQFNCFLAAHHHPKKPTESLINRGNVLNLEQEIENEILEDNLDENENESESESESENESESESESDNNNNVNDNNNNVNDKDTVNVDDKDTVNVNDKDTVNVDMKTLNNANNHVNNKSTSIFTREELKNLLNPHFFCPFPVSRAKTVEIRGYAGKLDWMLVRGWRVLAWGMDNEGYARSDHKLLWCHLKGYAAPTTSNSDEYYREAVEAYNYHSKTVKSADRPPVKFALNTWRNWWIGAGFTAGMAVAAGIIAYHFFNKD